jgi:hypothetical protein
MGTISIWGLTEIFAGRVRPRRYMAGGRVDPLGNSTLKVCMGNKVGLTLTQISVM